jgi:hypothetical protein
MNSRFDYAILDAIGNAFRAMKAAPLQLGATSSGVGGPPGGYVGYLTQGRVSYDNLEIASSGLVPSGISLIDNLNHIRYRLGVIESGGYPDSFLSLTDTPNTYAGSIGKAVVVNATATGLEFATISGGAGHTIQYNGTPLAARASMNFVGSGVIVTDDSINDATVITIAGGSGTGGGHIIQDEGVIVPNRTYLDFAGAAVSLSDTPPGLLFRYWMQHPLHLVLGVTRSWSGVIQ